MNMGIPVHQAPETLDCFDHYRDGVLNVEHDLIHFLHSLPRGTAELAEQCAVISKVQPEPFWDREYELPVGNVLQNPNAD